MHTRTTKLIFFSMVVLATSVSAQQLKPTEIIFGDNKYANHNEHKFKQH